MEKWFERADPLARGEWQPEVAASKLKLALHSLHEAQAETNKNITIFTAPAKLKGVTVTREYARGELQLVPRRPTICMRDLQERGNGIETDIIIVDGRTMKQKKVHRTIA